MIHYIEGDLLMSNCTVIMHQCNCFKSMGAGIARSIALQFPEALQADLEDKGTPRDRLGSFTYAKINNQLTVVNLYGQYDCGGGVKTQYGKLENAIDGFFTYAKEQDIDLSKVGVPYKMGCGLAGGDWSIVKGLLQKQSRKHNVDIYVYKL